MKRPGLEPTTRRSAPLAAFRPSPGPLRTLETGDCLETPPEAREPRCWSFTVPVDVSRTGKNELRRLAHWSQVASRVEAARVLARKAWIEAGEPKAAGKVRVSFIVRRGRRIDEGSVLSGVQPVIDGLFVEAMTKNDGPAALCFGDVTQESGAAWKGREEVVVLVEELGDAPALDAGRAARLEAVLAAAQMIDTYPCSLRDFQRLRVAVKNVEPT